MGDEISVKAGDEFCIPMVIVEYLSGGRCEYTSPKQLAEDLLHAYRHPENDVYHEDKNRVRRGYKSIEIVFVCKNGVKFSLRDRLGHFNYTWGAYGGPSVTGERRWLEMMPKPRESLYSLFEKDGYSLAQFFFAVSHSSTVGIVKYDSRYSGSTASDDYIMLNVHKSRGAVASGTFGILHSSARGDFIRKLYEWELADPDNPDYGRGDHVGNIYGTIRPNH